MSPGTQLNPNFMEPKVTTCLRILIRTKGLVSRKQLVPHRSIRDDRDVYSEFALRDLRVSDKNTVAVTSFTVGLPVL